MVMELLELEEEGKIRGGNDKLIVDDDLREMGKNVVWSVSFCKFGNGVNIFCDENFEIYWQLDFKCLFFFLIIFLFC